MSKIAVAIVNYNTREHLRSCLQSARPEGPAETFVVDNASSDGSAAMVAREFPRVLLRANGANLGFGAAANQAVAACRAPYVLLLNADTRLCPGALRALEAYLDRTPRAGIAGPRLVNARGGFEVSCGPFPTPFNTLLELSNTGRLLRVVPVLRRFYAPGWRDDRACRVPWVVGAALAIRREAFDAVHGFDESFFMYSEEIDLCFRLRAHGWQTHFAPAATIVHVGEASTEQQRVDMAVRSLTSTIGFYRRHYSHRRLRQLRFVLILAMVARLIRDGARLLGARAPSRRARLRDDMTIWRGVLRELRRGAAGAPSRHSSSLRP